MKAPTKLYVQITNACNLDCYQCYTGCSRTPPARELTTSEWRAFFDDLTANGVIHIHIEGGEPLCRGDFLDLAKHASRDMLVWCRTHATLIDDAVAADIKRAGVGMVAVDLFAADARINDFLAGVPGSYERTLNGIEALKRAGVNVVMLCILNRLNAASVSEYLDLALAVGVERVGLLRLYPLGRARRRWSELALSLDEMMDAVAVASSRREPYVMQSWHPQNGNCCWENAGVTSEGDSIGCPYLRDFVNYGNIRDLPFLKTWDHPLYRALRATDVRRGCGDCAKNEGTLGGCRATAYAFQGKWDAPDPFCTETNDGIDLCVLPDFEPAVARSVRREEER